MFSKHGTFSRVCLGQPIKGQINCRFLVNPLLEFEEILAREIGKSWCVGKCDTRRRVSRWATWYPPQRASSSSTSKEKLSPNWNSFKKRKEKHEVQSNLRNNDHVDDKRLSKKIKPQFKEQWLKPTWSLTWMKEYSQLDVKFKSLKIGKQISKRSAWLELKGGAQK